MCWGRGPGEAAMNGFSMASASRKTATRGLEQVQKNISQKRLKLDNNRSVRYLYI